MRCPECGGLNECNPGCPAAPEDDRDLLELTREERRARYHELSTIDLIEIIEGAIQAVDGLRHEVKALKRELGRVL